MMSLANLCSDAIAVSQLPWSEDWIWQTPVGSKCRNFLCVFFGSLKDAAGPDRVPGDSIYLGGPRPVEEYKALAASGAKWMGMGVSCAEHSHIPASSKPA